MLFFEVSLKVVVQYGNWTEPGRRPKPDFFPIFKDDKKLPVEEPSTFKRHPRYDPKLKLFDIAYIKFSTPVFKKEHVLPPCSQTKTNKHLKMTGMGDVIVPNKGAVPLQLQVSSFVKTNYHNKIISGKILNMKAY